MHGIPPFFVIEPAVLMVSLGADYLGAPRWSDLPSADALFGVHSGWITYLRSADTSRLPRPLVQQDTGAEFAFKAGNGGGHGL